MKILGIIGIILLCILAVPVYLTLLVLLLCSFKTRIRVKLTPEEKELWVSHLFFEKQLYPLPPKKKSPQKKTPKKKKTAETETSSEKKKGEGIGELVLAKVKALTLPNYIEFLGMFKEGFIDRITFERLHLKITVGTPSADLTAQRYGQLTAAIFPLLGKLDAAGKIKDGQVNVSPDFLCEETTVITDTDVSFRIIHVFTWAMKVVFKILTK